MHPQDEVPLYESKRKAIAKADDDRWGLYYGAKLLARESDEAKLFWSLLDESHGADFLAFVLYCCEMIRGTSGAILRAQQRGAGVAALRLASEVRAAPAPRRSRCRCASLSTARPYSRRMRRGSALSVLLGTLTLPTRGSRKAWSRVSEWPSPWAGAAFTPASPEI